MSNSNNIIVKLVIVLVVVILLFHTEIELNLTSYSDVQTKFTDMLFKKDIENIRNHTNDEIKTAEEKGYTQQESKINPNDGPNFNEEKFDEFVGRNKTIYFFYSANCIHTQQFLPIWYRIKNRLPSSVDAVEYNSDDDQATNKFQQYNIKSVPSLVLDYSDNTVIYNGNKSESDVEKFLNLYGIILNVDSSEGFVDFDTNEHNNVVENLNLINTNTKSDLDKEIDEIQMTNLETNIKANNSEGSCPDITFDKKMNRTNNTFSFQIFDKNGLHGYSKGGTGQPFDSFHAAYNCFDTYLSTLPQKNIMDKCAMKYKRQIRDFGLCDEIKLDKIAHYGDSVESGAMNERIEDVNYDSNKKVVASIKKACAI